MPTPPPTEASRPPTIAPSRPTARLRGYLRDFQRVAEVATEEAPQQREKLGIATPA